MAPRPASGEAPFSGDSGSGQRFFISLGAILAAGLALRLAYLAAQPAVDPRFALPAFDGAYYASWARAILGHGAGPTGAFYLAPLYPYLLAGLFAVVGERFALLYALQHLVSVLTAGTLAVQGRRAVGDAGALAAAALYLLYAPLIFFASRPLGETVALLPLFAALGLARGTGHARAAGAGALTGLAALARPNLLLVPILWTAAESYRGRWRRAAWMVLGIALAVAPITVRNAVVSGHWVPVSSNGGLTLYHGNGPGARGVFTAPAGLSGDPLTQRDEATLVARVRSGLDLDPVEADAWWGRQALRARAHELGNTLVLLVRRALLSLDSHEYALDYAPSIDEDPWRPTIRVGRALELPLVPFGLLAGLALAGLVLRGARGTGGVKSWLLVAACAAGPLLFYVSSRYRLPLAAALTLPAGAGLAALLSDSGGTRVRRRLVGWAVLAVVFLGSMILPFGNIRAGLTAHALANRANGWLRAGDPRAARRSAERAMGLDPGSAIARYNAGVIADTLGERSRAEARFREALERDPGLVEAAVNLSRILVEDGTPQAAIAPLREALARRPSSRAGWTNLVVALTASGHPADALRACDEAAGVGVEIEPGLRRSVEAALGAADTDEGDGS